MITGAHSIIYSSDAQADIDFFKNVLKFPNVDAGRGWLIFGLPPSEVAVHPAEESGLNEFYLLCDDVQAFVAEMAEHQITCSGIDIQRWGMITHLTLPGGGKIGVYEPRHARP
ncbi:MAG TPA: hypothetical protein VNX40_13365 [Mucilaginibacter sp.]|jgi:hypothetical protein|nr:hypothetical protein [Mucilaginibacter sp.]